MGVKERYEERKKKGETASYSGVRERSIAKEIDGIASSISERTNTWLKNHSNYLKNYNYRYSGRKGTYEDSYVSDASEWLSTIRTQKENFDKESSSILSMLDDYGDYLNKNWSNSIRSALKTASKQQEKILKSAKRDSEFWEKYPTEEDYRKEVDEYKAYLSQQKEYEEKLNLDTAAAKKEIEDLENYMDDNSNIEGWYTAYLMNPGAWDEETINTNIARYNELVSKYGSSEQLESLIQEKMLYLKNAERVQEAERLASVSGNSDFSQYSGYVSTKSNGFWDKLGSQYSMGYNDLTYEYINNQNGIRDEIKHKAQLFRNTNNPFDDGLSTFEKNGYDYMTENEISIYNYYYAKDGKEAAEKYLDSIQETLNLKKAKERFPELEGKTAAELLFGIEAGLDQFQSGAKGLWNSITGNDEYVPASSTQITSSMVREDLADDSIPLWYNFKTGKWENTILGRSLGQMAYDTVTTSSNMLPSVMTSTVISAFNPVAGQIAGASLLGASAGGNAYQEMINLGYDKNQSRLYAGLVGASEAGLEYLLGGIGKLGGKITGNAIGKILNNVDNAFARVAIKLGGSMASEFTEEYLQDVLDPWFKNIAFGMENDINLFTTDALYSGLLGALTALLFEGPGTVSENIHAYTKGKKLQNSKVTAQRLADIGKTFSPDTVAYQLAGRVNEKTGAYTIGRLFNEIGAELTESNKADIASYLERQGVLTKDAKFWSEVFSDVVVGGQFTDKQIAMINANDTLSKAVLDVIINPNSTVNQRSQGYNQVLMDLAMEKSGAKPSKTESAAPDGSIGNPANAGEKIVTSEGNLTADVKKPSETGYAVSADGKTVRIDTEDTIDLNGLAQDEDGTYKIAVKDSESVSVDNVSFSDRNTGMVYETFVSLGDAYGKTNKVISNMSLDNRNALIDLYDKNINKDGGEFARGAVSAFYYGYQGIGLDSVSEGSPVMSLSEEQRKAAWNLGRIAAMSETTEAQSDIDANYEEAKKVLDQNGETKKGEYHATLADDISPSSLTPAEKESYKFADYVAQAAQANIRVYKSDTGERGYYNPKTDEICLNLNARNLSKQTMMAFTLGHELVHRAKKGSPAKYKAFSEFLLNQYGKNSKTLDAMVGEQLAAAKEFGISMTADGALTEVICDACQKMLLDTNAGQKLAEFGAQSKENRGFLEDLKRWITEVMDRLRNFFRGVEPDSLAAKEFVKLDDNVKQILADMFVEMTIDAGEKLSTIKTAFGNETVVETNEQGEFTIAKSEDGSKLLYNLTTWENGGRNTLEATLSREGFSDEDIKAALTIMDSKYDLVKKLAEQFPEQNRVNKATITTDLKDGHAVLSAIVSNGEYPVNIDLLMVCKKRQAYQRVINRLCETGLIEQATLDSLAIAEINKILGKYGFETACLGCFVESRRLRIQEWAETICKEWNGLVDKKIGKGNAKAFNFADERKFVKDMTNADVQALAMELDDAYENDRLHYGKTTVVKKMAKLIDEVPSLRRHLSVADLITPQGRTRLKSVSSELNSLIACRYGSNTPKIVQSFNPYNHELAIYGKVPSQYNSLREYLYAIGGARMQSFSDFIVENWFDYCQIVADLASRKLPMHTYSKEIVMIKLFGMTGIKENMSLIPDVDKSLGKEYAGLTRNANGDLELIFADKDRFKATNGKSYMQSINFADAVKIQNDPRYSANCGTIAIGISDKQIEIMLDDSRIRMVIPYHSSGMNPIFADLVGTSFYKDYTDFQNTTVDYLLDSNGNRVNLKLTKAQRDNLTAGFEFNQVLQELGDARAAAQEYKDWCADSSQHSITIDGVTYNAVLTPKFSQFADHKNYYKLLADFNCYDCITEKAAPQGDVQQIYPEEFSEILTEELSRQESNRQKQEKNRSFDKAMAEIESYLKEHTKADTVYYAQQKGIKLSKKDSKLNASDKGKLKKLQEEGVSFSLPKVDDIKPDENRISQNIDSVAVMDSVYSVDASKLSDSGKTISQIYSYYFAKWGENIHSDVFGDIATKNSSIRSEFRHGNTAAKIASIEAIPTVINSGKIVGWIEKNNGTLFRIIVAAPITIGKNSYIMGVMLQRDNQYQRLYLHDVVIEKEASDSSQDYLVSTGSSEDNENLFTTSILQKILYVKHKNKVRLDKAYMDAVNSGDMLSAQEMVDDAANKAGFVYKRNTFQTNNPVKGSPHLMFVRSESNDVLSGYGEAQFCATADGAINIEDIFDDIKKLADDFYGEDSVSEDEINPPDIVMGAGIWDDIDFVQYMWDNYFEQIYYETDRIPAVVLNDGMIVYGNDETRIKSADPVVYDDSGKVIPLTERFNKGKDDIRYKLPVGEDTSNRSLLANALESTAKDDIERKKIREYKEKIELLNAEEQKLQDLNAQVKELYFAKGPRDKAKIRALREEAVKTANRINTYDRMLLRLEASQPLQNVLEREKKAAYRKAEQKGKEALEAYRKDAIKKQQDILDRWQKSREKGIDSRNRTAMRHKIQNVVGELNQYLLKGTKDRHVPIELQKAVAEALDAVNMDTVGAEERIAKLKEELLKAKTAEQIQEISRKIERIQAMGDRMNDRLQALKDAYDKFTKSDDPLIANSHDDVISAKLDSVIDTVGDTPLRDMSLSQLKDVYDMYRMVLTTIRNANKAFKAKKSESISAMGNEVMMEVERAGGKTKLRLKGTGGISNFDWNNMKPVYAFERIGSDTLTELFNNVRSGEDTWAVDVTEAREYYLEKAKKYNYDSWDFNSRYTFTSTSGMEFSLSLEQILSLYAYSKREQAAEHLKRGGIVFDETTEVTVKTKLGIPLKFNPTEATAYNISENTLADIIGKLSDEQKAFADEMQDYLSSVMGSKGNEVSLELYGIKLFNEKFYFPLKSAKQFMEKAREQQQGDAKIKNKGFSKDTVPKASNPIVLTPFMNVWADHVNEMSMYHAFVLPMEDFYRVYNFKTPVSETDAEKSVNMFLQNAYGKGATNYIDQLLKDLNGGARSDPRENTAKVLMSKFKKAAVMASLSVVIQQPSAIARAFAMIDPKYFRPTKDGMNHAQLWEELKKYAPVAVIKEMGYFDTNMGRSTNDFIKAKEYTGFKEKAKALFTDSGYRDELISKAPSLADEVTWCAIWNAVKRETVSKHHDLSPSSEEFLKLAGERFTEVVTKTQVYDSVLARSGNMRSKTAFMNMWTSFMAEPTTSINMVQDALLKAKRGDKRYAVKAIGSVCASVILNAALVSLVYAMRDDDDDETYLEKYVSRFLTETLDGLNPLTYIPFLRDVWSVMQGFDIDRADMSLVTDLVNSLQKIVKVMNTDTYGMDEDEIAEHNRKVAEAWLSAVDSISSLTGIPFRNFRRDLNGAVNLVKTLTKDAQGRQTTAGSLMDVILDDVKASTPIWGWMPGESKADKLYDAIVSGDTAYVDRLKSGYDSEESYYSALRNAVKKRYVSGDISYETAIDFLIEQCGMSEDDAYWKLDEWNSGADGDDYSKYAEFYEAVQTGNNLKAVIKRYTDNGVKPETLSSQITDYFKPLYIEMSKSERASIKGYLRNAMVYCGEDDDEAMEKLQHWDFLADNPDYRDISQAEATKYYEYAEPNGISVSVYCDYCERASQCESDKDKNGNPIDGSKKKKILEVIDSLPITKKQKDALYYASGFAASSIYEAPWRR